MTSYDSSRSATKAFEVDGESLIPTPLSLNLPIDVSYHFVEVSAPSAYVRTCSFSLWLNRLKTKNKKMFIIKRDRKCGSDSYKFSDSGVVGKVSKLRCLAGSWINLGGGTQKGSKKGQKWPICHKSAGKGDTRRSLFASGVCQKSL